MNRDQGSSAFPLKRKRGRPRKNWSLKHVGNPRVPPGFGLVTANQTHQVNASDHGNDGAVGQAVTGVVEAAFDAGYLLTVRIGNSNTRLRGVVFKPGHFVPVTAENDVAPHIQMIKRNEIQSVGESQTWVRGGSSSGERIVQHVNYSGNWPSPVNQVQRLALQSTNPVTSKGKHVSAMGAPSIIPVGVRGTVVPVVLQPVNISNGLPASSQALPTTFQVSHDTMALKVKDVQPVAPLAVYPANGTFSDLMLGAASLELPVSPQGSHQVTLRDVPNENDPFSEGMVDVEIMESKTTMSMKPTGVATLEGDQCSSPLTTCNQNSEKTSKQFSEETVSAPERDIGDMNVPLSVEPLQILHSVHHNQSMPVSEPSDSIRTGRMNELLQENESENQAHLVEQHMATSSG